MSSSHRKKAPTSEPLPCPECGKTQMIRVVETCQLADGLTVKKLEHYKCSSCNSRFFDDNAMHDIQATRASLRSLAQTSWFLCSRYCGHYAIPRSRMGSCERGKWGAHLFLQLIYRIHLPLTKSSIKNRLWLTIDHWRYLRHEWLFLCVLRALRGPDNWR